VILLDASALLAFLFTEHGGDVVAAQIQSSCLSSVNLAEVISRFVRDGHSAEAVYQQLAGSGIEIVPFLAEDAVLAAGLITHSQKHGLSLADRACLALALRRNIPVFTADQVWSKLDLPIAIQQIRANAPQRDPHGRAVFGRRVADYASRGHHFADVRCTRNGWRARSSSSSRSALFRR
jgi:ribonuclease VapC